MISVALIAENKTVRESLQAAISLEPGCCWVGTWCATEEELIEIANLSPEVILVDAQFDGMTAVDCTSRIKSKLPLARVIVLLVYEDPEHIHRLMQAGASAYLLKRSNLRQIMSAIRAAGGSKSSDQHEQKRNGKHALSKSPQLRS